MTPLVEDQLARARLSFKGRIYVLKDFENSALVCLWPDGWWRTGGPEVSEDSPPGDWLRMTEPFLMLIDPARCGDDGPKN